MGLIRLLPTFLLLFSSQLYSAETKSGFIKGFIVQTGHELGIYFRPHPEAEPTLLRLCHPTQIGVDNTFFFYDLSKKAQTEGHAVEIDYIEGGTIDPVTKRNKLCVEQLVY